MEAVGPGGDRPAPATGPAPLPAGRAAAPQPGQADPGGADPANSGPLFPSVQACPVLPKAAVCAVLPRSGGEVSSGHQCHRGAERLVGGLREGGVAVTPEPLVTRLDEPGGRPQSGFPLALVP